jgi:hypothetical protein
MKTAFVKLVSCAGDARSITAALCMALGPDLAKKLITGASDGAAAMLGKTASDNTAEHSILTDANIEKSNNVAALLTRRSVSLAASLPRCLAASLPRCLAASLPRCLADRR